ncbi:hypothetical protein BpHYR1_003882 [Brachionus plicatilis]|uniref:Uncharacterized protein n=1 Tax=Brachionus plicatilis TaxID=10195 RepID=A0A3M7Q6B4_BRAPC|nr:hypothetical protein BpHYR1_003882 [Brachionus plicatilis]
MTTKKRSKVNATINHGEIARHTLRSKANERHIVCFWSVMFMGKSIFHKSTISLQVLSRKCVTKNMPSDTANAIR